MPRVPIAPGDGDPAHGTLNGYRNKDCRCKKCRAAQSARQRAYRAERKALGLSGTDPRHGTLNAYVNFGCRCGACTDANATDSRERAKRKRGDVAPVTDSAR